METKKIFQYIPSSEGLIAFFMIAASLSLIVLFATYSSVLLPLDIQDIETTLSVANNPLIWGMLFGIVILGSSGLNLINSFRCYRHGVLPEKNGYIIVLNVGILAYLLAHGTMAHFAVKLATEYQNLAITTTQSNLGTQTLVMAIMFLIMSVISVVIDNINEKRLEEQKTEVIQNGS